VNKYSGLLGISGISSDMREIDAAVQEGKEKAILSLKMYNYRIKKYIGAYAAALGGVDILVFTGGVGENQSTMRKTVCENMEYMGIEIDDEANKTRGEEAIISQPHSKVKVVVIPTDEEYMIALDTMNILNQ
jgi:acetate kinase